VSISERNGSLWIRVHIGGGKYASATVRGLNAGSRREAELVEARLKIAKADGKLALPDRGTLEAFLEEWFATMKGNWLPGTRAKTRSVLDAQIIPALGNVRLTRLSTEEIDRFYGRLRGKGHAPSYTRSVHSILHGALEQARRWKRIAVNPAADASPGKVPKRLVDPPAAAEVGAFVNAVGQVDADYATLFTLSATTGIRPGELLALRLTDLALEGTNPRVTIRRRLSREENGSGYTVVDLTKGGGIRTVQIDPSIAAMVASHVTRMRERGLALGVKLSPRAYLFSDAPDCSTFRRPDSVSRRFRTLRDRLTMTGRFYDLRHSHVTELLDAGMNVSLIAKRIGHARSSTTLNFYVSDEPEGDAEAARLSVQRLGLTQSIS
jgi:integrase